MQKRVLITGLIILIVVAALLFSEITGYAINFFDTDDGNSSRSILTILGICASLFALYLIWHIISI